MSPGNVVGDTSDTKSRSDVSPLLLRNVFKHIFGELRGNAAEIFSNSKSVIHLPLKALEGGPICPWWMFPFERYMKKLKGYVRNKAKPEGSISEGYVVEEAFMLNPSNNEHNEANQEILVDNNEPNQATRNEFEELYASANEELYPGCDYVTRLDFMAKFTYFKAKGRLTESIFNEMLEFFQNVFPIRKGVETIDVASGQKFNMRAMVLWTINDFPARSSLSGWSGKGYKACPTCNEDTLSVRVLSKTAYVGHR
ncbi:RNA-directed DNA polymerase, eukaryota, partial [Tanacetum coccineum]